MTSRYILFQLALFHELFSRIKMICSCRRYNNKKNVQTLLLYNISFQLYTVTSLERSVNGLISVILFKTTITNITFNITNLQDNYLGTYVSMSKFATYANGCCVDIFMYPVYFLEQVTDPPMYNIASAVTCRSLAIVRSFPLPGDVI